MIRETKVKEDSYIDFNNMLYDHISSVGVKMNKIASILEDRAFEHDASKWKEPEYSLFRQSFSKLSEIEYGTEEYRENLRQIKPAITHHYANNSHHPEHYDNGIDGMDLVDLTEMLCDWLAAIKRGKNGDIMKSMDYNAERFNMSPQLTNILKNTIERYFNE